MADYGIDMQSGRVWWLYQARRIATQGNAGGGAIQVDITCAAGQTMKLVSLSARNSGNNGLNVYVLDEDNAGTPAHAYLAGVAAGAGAMTDLPAIGSVATATANTIFSAGLIIGPGQKLNVGQSAAGLQNDTLTIAVSLLLSTSTEPTWSKARSTNEADVALAASTISATNTLQAVVL